MSRVYQLSEMAEKDLESIFDETKIAAGLDRAILEVLSFEKAFALILKHPNSGLNRDEIKQGLRSFIHQNHVIFYKKQKNRIWIVRILNGND